MQRHFFFHPPSPFPSNFCNCNSGSICTASQFWVQLPLLYTAWRNANSEIGLEVMLWPLTTSCMKDYKRHSLMQTNFTELRNRLAMHSPKPCELQVLFSAVGLLDSGLLLVVKLTASTESSECFWSECSSFSAIAVNTHMQDVLLFSH